MNADVIAVGRPTVGHPNRADSGSWRTGDVLICDTLATADYHAVLESAGVVCVRAGRTSHAAVVARILGLPVVAVSAGDLAIIERHNWITIDTVAGIVVTGTSSDAPPAANRQPAPLARLLAAGTRVQLSIIDDARLLTRIGQLFPTHLLQLFLRSEFIWFGSGTLPLNTRGDLDGSRVAATLWPSLFTTARNMPKGATLNFRGLDLRSDQGPVSGAHRQHEPNPSLGLHGTRALLVCRDYLEAELGAAAELRRTDEVHHVVYSLPFVALTREVEFVFQVRHNIGADDLEIGLFVETPASVEELDRMLSLGIRNVSIGTKDLAQLVVGADRDVPEVRSLLTLSNDPIAATIRRAVEICERHDVRPFVFGVTEDIPFLLDEFGDRISISLGAGELLNAAEQGVDDALHLREL